MAPALGAPGQALQDAGCFAVVLECVPPLVAACVTRELGIPTIGIGAGPHCSGQVRLLASPRMAALTCRRTCVRTCSIPLCSRCAVPHHRYTCMW